MNREKTISYNINEVEEKTLDLMKKLAKSAHFIDIKFRDNGEDKFFSIKTS